MTLLVIKSWNTDSFKNAFRNKYTNKHKEKEIYFKATASL